MRFNHMELTLPKGTLDAAFRKDVGRFYGDRFGWSAMDIDLLQQSCLYLQVDPGQFLLLAESDKPISVPGYDHLGLLLDDRSDVDSLLEKCLAFQQQDERVEIKQYDDLVQGPVTVRAFYVRYLLPIYFDVQCMEWQPGSEPDGQWVYTSEQHQAHGRDGNEGRGNA
jgi:hypothetical protein